MCIFSYNNLLLNTTKSTDRATSKKIDPVSVLYDEREKSQPDHNDGGGGIYYIYRYGPIIHSSHNTDDITKLIHKTQQHNIYVHTVKFIQFPVWWITELVPLPEEATYIIHNFRQGNKTCDHH